MLEALEKKWQVLRQSKTETSSWFSYGTSMVTNILENIQVSHAQYHIEDKDLSLIKRKYACNFYTDFDDVYSYSLSIHVI